MKKNKIVGLLVAAAGSVASISAAAALYVKAATDAHFGIGAEWHGLEGTITYKINGLTSGTAEPSYLKANGTNGGTGFSVEYTQAHYSFPVGASFGTGVPAQSFVVGNFKVDLTNISNNLKNKAHIWVCVNGYIYDEAKPEDESVGHNLFATCFMNSDVALDADSYSVNHDIAVSANGTQTVDVYVKLDAAVSESEMMSLAEGHAFDISVTWGAPSADYKFAHVVGDKTMWQEDDVYAMVPNINKKNSEGYEWMFSNLPGDMANAKCKKGDDWSADPNAALDSSKTYDVYWSGNTADAASFVEQK